MEHDAEGAGGHEKTHHDPQQQDATGAADRDVAHDYDERERDEEERYELRRVLVVREQDELCAGTCQAKDDDRQ